VLERLASQQRGALDEADGVLPAVDEHEPVVTVVGEAAVDDVRDLGAERQHGSVLREVHGHGGKQVRLGFRRAVQGVSRNGSQLHQATQRSQLFSFNA
jgi:hypothetical protein